MENPLLINRKKTDVVTKDSIVDIVVTSGTNSKLTFYGVNYRVSVSTESTAQNMFNAINYTTKENVQFNFQIFFCRVATSIKSNIFLLVLHIPSTNM